MAVVAVSGVGEVDTARCSKIVGTDLTAGGTDGYGEVG